MASLQKNVASQNFAFSLVNATNGAASATSSTGSLTAFVTKDGTQASAGGTFSYLGTGEWNYAPTQSETNCTNFALYVTSNSSDIPFHGTVWTDPGVLLTQGTGTNQITLSSGNVTVGSVLATAGTSVADQFLDRDMSVGVDSGSSAFRTPRQAFRVLRNKVDVSSGTTLIVFKEDDATTSWTASVTVSSSAQPIVTLTPP
jgi:hypothetical protein